MSGSTSHVITPRVLLEGLAFPESPLWHEGRLCFSDWGTDEIIAVDLEGNREVAGRGSGGLGWAVNWLPGHRMLISGSELVRVEPDGTRLPHGDLNAVSPLDWSELTVNGRGNAVDTIELDRACFAAMLGGPERRTLFMLTAEWPSTEGIEGVGEARTGQVLVADAPSPAVGWP